MLCRCALNLFSSELAETSKHHGNHGSLIRLLRSSICSRIDYIYCGWRGNYPARSGHPEVRAGAGRCDYSRRTKGRRKTATWLFTLCQLVPGASDTVLTWLMVLLFRRHKVILKSMLVPVYAIKAAPRSLWDFNHSKSQYIQAHDRYTNIRTPKHIVNGIFVHTTSSIGLGLIIHRWICPFHGAAVSIGPWTGVLLRKQFL